MENANGPLWEVSIWEFVFVTGILAGAGAFMTGRAVAQTWRPNATLVLYALLLAAATRFIHFALFSGSLLSLHYYVIDFIVIIAIAFVGKHVTRAGQMAGQYGFEYESRGSFSWAKKNQVH